MGCFFSKEPSDKLKSKQEDFQIQTGLGFWQAAQKKEIVLKQNQTMLEEMMTKGKKRIINWEKNSQLKLLREECGKEIQRKFKEIETKGDLYTRNKVYIEKYQSRKRNVKEILRKNNSI